MESLSIEVDELAVAAVVAKQKKTRPPRAPKSEPTAQFMPPDVVNDQTLPKPRVETFETLLDIINRIKMYAKEVGFFVHAQKQANNSNVREVLCTKNRK